MALRYFLTIDGLNGGSLVEGYLGAFEIDGFDFDVSALAGDKVFSPLTVDLILNSGLTGLLDNIAIGLPFPLIRIEGVTDTGQTVYDLKLGNVVVTSVHDAARSGDTVLDSLTFDYSQVTLTTIDGKVPVTFGWDIGRDEALKSLPNPVAATGIGSGGGGALQYFLTIDGLNGGSLFEGHSRAFEIDGFDFDVSALMSAVKGSGDAIFSPLTVDLLLRTGLTALLGATGQPIRSIRIEGVIPESGETVYDLRLGDVVLTKVHDAYSIDTVPDSLTFDYSQVSLTTRPVNAIGELGNTFGWDITHNHPISVPIPTVPTGNPGVVAAKTYFLTIDGLNGGSQVVGHLGAFEIDGFDFDVSALAGGEVFSPLTVDLILNSGLTRLLGLIDIGKPLPSIRIEGVTDTGQTVYDLTLGSVVVTSVHNTRSGDDTVLDRLTFDYSQVTLTTKYLDPTDGSPGSSQTFTWPPGASVPIPKVAGADSGGDGALKYFLTIDGLNGGSLVEGYLGAFEIDGFDFDVSALAGDKVFSPLTVDLILNSGLTGLLDNIAIGLPFPLIRIEGVTDTGQTVYDLKLGNVVVTSVHDAARSGDTVLDSLTFDYSQVTLTTIDGKVPVTFGWDIGRDEALKSLPNPVAATGIGSGGGGALQYFLTIDGLNGGSLFEGHSRAFEIDGFDFDVSALMSAVKGSGDAIFSPLTVDLLLRTGLTALLGATGQPIRSIRIEGVIPESGETVYDLRLGDVVLTKVHDAYSIDTVPDSLTFDYSQVSLTTRPVNAIGELGNTFGWDITHNHPISVPIPTVPTGNPGVVAAKTYFLTIDGLNGGSQVVGHLGAFEIDGFDFDVSALAGGEVFSPLTVDLILNSGLTRLLGLIDIGKPLPSIRIEGVTDTGQTVYDLTLGSVVVTSVHNTRSGDDTVLDRLTFDYSQVTLTTKYLDPTDGSPGSSQTFTWALADVNAAPVITSDGGAATAAVNAAENQTAVTTVTSTDVDTGALTYSIAGGADQAKFAINATTGVLTFVAKPNFEAPTDAGGDNVYDVTVKVSDGSLTDAQDITVTVNNVNDAPVITSDGGASMASVNAAENQTAVTTVTSTDVDTGALTYSIAGGADQAKFAINATTGVLTFVAKPNFEAPTDAGGDNVYDVTVKVSDGSLTDAQDITVTVNNVNDAPVITSDGGASMASVNAAENQTAVTTVTSTDVDTGALTYSIAGGADQAKFAINATTGVLTFVAKPNFEAPTDAGGDNVYDVTVKVSDGSLTDAQDITVTVNNVNDAPVITSDGGASMASVNAAENQTAVTTVTSTDVDTGALTYSIAGGADQAKFAINATTGVLTFVSAPDFETKADAGADGVYDVTVQVSDGSLADSQAIAVTVTNVNEAPVITSNGGDTTASVNAKENQTAVTTVTSTDVDTGAVLTYSIVGGADQAKFDINATTGVLTFVSAPDFETKADAGADGVYDVTVQVSDGSLADSQAIAVTVTNVNEAPVITSNGGDTTASVNAKENQTAVTTVTSTDVDTGAVLTYSIVGGADRAQFAINATTGVLTFVSAPDFETKTDAGADGVYDVTVQVSDGSLTDSQAIAVTVTNANDAPTGQPFISDATPTEGQALSASPGSIVDPDGTTTSVFSYQWQAFNGTIWTNIAGATSATFAPTQAQVGQTLHVVASYTDDFGMLEPVTSAATGIVGDRVIDTAGNVAHTLPGTEADDILMGLGGNDKLNGLAGNDLLNGDAGNDILNGGVGDDVMTGGTGNDTYVVDSLGDTVVEAIGEGTDTIETTLNSFSLAGIANVENLRFTGAGDFVGIGNALANTITGGGGNDRFVATIGDGNDLYVGGNGVDTLDLSGTTAAATISGSSATSTQIGSDGLSGIENIIGSQGNDVITGTGSANVIDGGAGNDTINAGGGTDRVIGGAGNDILDGGGASDIFVFASGFGNDVINAFDANPNGGQDFLDISMFGITTSNFAARVAITGNGADTFVTIDDDPGQTIQLVSIKATTVTQADFLF